MSDKTLHKCAARFCVGLPWRASDYPHPQSCNERPGDPSPEKVDACEPWPTATDAGVAVEVATTVAGAGDDFASWYTDRREAANAQASDAVRRFVGATPAAYYCQGSKCPGLPFPAGESWHPLSCTDHDCDVAGANTRPGTTRFVGTSGQAEPPVSGDSEQHWPDFKIGPPPVVTVTESSQYAIGRAAERADVVAFLTGEIEATSSLTLAGNVRRAAMTFTKNAIEAGKHRKDSE